MARYGAESATFGGVVFKRAKIWGGCFGYWKIQNGPSVFHIDPLHGLIWPRCKGQFSPKFWYQNSPISVGLNWPQKQYHSGLTRFGPIFGAKLALFILQKLSQGEATNKNKGKQLVGGQLHVFPTLNNKLFFQFVVSKKVIRSETRSRRSLDMKFLNILSYKVTFQGFNVVTTRETWLDLTLPFTINVRRVCCCRGHYNNSY